VRDSAVQRATCLLSEQVLVPFSCHLSSPLLCGSYAGVNMDLDSADQRTLQLLNDIQTRLSAALDRLREPGEPALRYRLHCADFINHSVNGFAHLRASERIRASQILIRPTIECYFRMRAVQEHPELLYGIALQEFQEEKKLLKAAMDPDAAAIAALEEKLTAFRQSFHATYPHLPVREVAISAYDAATVIQLQPYHDLHYQLYSKYTHALLRNRTGAHAPESTVEDTRTMCFCALAALETVPGCDAEYVESTRRLLQSYDFMPKTGARPK